jgi:hypothetical protein
MINREVEKIYAALNAAKKNYKRNIEKGLNLNIMRRKAYIHSFESPYLQNEWMLVLKNAIRRRTANEIAMKTFNKIFQEKTGTPLGPAHNVLLKKLKTAWTPTGRFKNKRQKLPLFRNPVNGSVLYMNTNGVWRNMTGPNRPNMPSKTYIQPGTSFFNYLKNVNVWQNKNGSVWVYMNGKWHRFNPK